MDREIWRHVLAAVRSADRRVMRRGRRPRYSDQQIVKMLLWTIWHDRPLCWAGDRDHYTTMYRPTQLPSVSQFCRRVRTERVTAMLEATHSYLARGSGLAPLPHWVRRLHRVQRWVTAKLVIYHARLRSQKEVA